MLILRSFGLGLSLINIRSAWTAIIACKGKKEIILELRRPLVANQRKALESAGFAPSNVDMTWTIVGDVDDQTSVGLSDRLAKVGILLREIRFREPGLDSLFLHLSRPENQPEAVS